jgi:tetratricopeptide (TPR) repeat protein
MYANKLVYVLGNKYLADRYLDTGKIYLVKALKFDKKNIDAATYLRGYYIQKGLVDEADKLLPLSENRVKNYIYYGGKLFEFLNLNDRYRSIEAHLNYLETKPADVPIPDYITKVAFYNYLNTGFPARAREINEKYWESVHDTLNYFFRKAELEINYGSQDSAVSICSWLYDIHPAYLLVHFYFVDQSYKLQRACAKEFNMLPNVRGKENFVADPVPPNFYVFGYTYLKDGIKEKADYHFEGSIKKAEEEIELNTANARSYNSHFNLATIYAILNDKQKSLQYLGMIKESRSIPLNFIDELKTNPMFDKVRNEPEFQKIARELEKKYLEEHEKIKKLLKKHGFEPA